MRFCCPIAVGSVSNAKLLPTLPWLFHCCGRRFDSCQRRACLLLIQKWSCVSQQLFSSMLDFMICVLHEVLACPSCPFCSCSRKAHFPTCFSTSEQFSFFLTVRICIYTVSSFLRQGITMSEKHPHAEHSCTIPHFEPPEVATRLVVVTTVGHVGGGLNCQSLTGKSAASGSARHYRQLRPSPRTHQHGYSLLISKEMFVSLPINSTPLQCSCRQTLFLQKKRDVLRLLQLFDPIVCRTFPQSLHEFSSSTSRVDS